LEKYNVLMGHDFRFLVMEKSWKILGLKKTVHRAGSIDEWLNC